jgi:hypothetical protein
MMTETGSATVVERSKNENSPLYGDGSNGPTALSNFLRIEIFRCRRVRKNAFIDSAFEVAQPLHLRKKTSLLPPSVPPKRCTSVKMPSLLPLSPTTLVKLRFNPQTGPRTHRASPAHNDLKNCETSGQLPHRSQVLPSSGNQRYP